jgi:hypothetical protein
MVLEFWHRVHQCANPPMVHGEYVYIGVNNTLRKIEKETGKEVVK